MLGEVNKIFGRPEIIGAQRKKKNKIKEMPYDFIGISGLEKLKQITKCLTSIQ